MTSTSQTQNDNLPTTDFVLIILICLAILTSSVVAVIDALNAALNTYFNTLFSVLISFQWLT